jgi:hypothetical protein
MTTVEASAAWLVEGLRAYGVLLRLDDRRRHYWLPGVGAFALFQHAASPPVVGGPLGKLRPHPTIRVQPRPARADCHACRSRTVRDYHAGHERGPRWQRGVRPWLGP